MFNSGLIGGYGARGKKFWLLATGHFKKWRHLTQGREGARKENGTLLSETDVFCRVYHVFNVHVWQIKNRNIIVFAICLFEPTDFVIAQYLCIFVVKQRH